MPLHLPVAGSFRPMTIAPPARPGVRHFLDRHAVVMPERFSRGMAV